MKIDKAVQALREGKVVHCPNSFETMKKVESDLGDKVECSLINSEEKQVLYLTRFEILYKHCDFALGKHPTIKPASNKAAAPDETK